jgi:NADPH2:quinone reductase
MAWGGRFLVVGFASGDIPRIPLNLLLLKGCAAIGVFWGEAVKRNPAAHRANMASVLNWVATGALKARIDRVYPLEDTAEALRMIEQRKVVGKILLTTATT